jgi:hypothetical protein
MKILLDEKEITIEEFEKIKEEYDSDKSKGLKEIRKGIYKTILKG